MNRSSKQTLHTETEAQEEPSESLEVTDITLPAPPEELTFFEGDDGVLYAEHNETGETTAIVEEAGETELAPALINTESEELEVLDGTRPMPMQENTADETEAAARRRGD